MKQSSSVQGVPRRMGPSKDGLRMLEVFGSKNEIYRVTLTSGIAKDAGLLTASRAMLVSVFLVRNVAPGWPEGPKWVVDAIGGQEPQVITRDGKRFKIAVTMGIVSLRVEPE